jgi:selenoprotein W-related protein
VRTVSELLRDYQHVISELDVVTGSKGIFNVEVDGEMLFSKKQAGRHAHDGEVLRLFRERYAAGVKSYQRD